MSEKLDTIRGTIAQRYYYWCQIHVLIFVYTQHISQQQNIDYPGAGLRCFTLSETGSRPESKTWRFFYSGDLWPEGLLASLTYINGPSGNRQIWKVLQWKSDKHSKMNIRTLQSNDPIQGKMLFYISGPDFVVISTTFMWYFRTKQSSIWWPLYSPSRWHTKIWFCNLMLLPYRLLLQDKFLTIQCQIF